MTPLVHQQQALLQAVFGRSDEAALRELCAQPDSLRIRGLQAYRSNGHALAQRALAAAFPVLRQLLGDENFASLARAFWHSHPPVDGDMALWGEQLPDFAGQAPQLADEPYLADVARVEWALHSAATAADAVADPGSFRLLVEQDPGAITLVLVPGLNLIVSPWPVVSIIQAHVTGEPGLAVAGERLRVGAAETALVWRQGFKPMLREAALAEAGFLAALGAGDALDAALDAVANAAPDASGKSSGDFDFNAWLATAVRCGLVTGAKLLVTQGETT